MTTKKCFRSHENVLQRGKKGLYSRRRRWESPKHIFVCVCVCVEGFYAHNPHVLCVCVCFLKNGNIFFFGGQFCRNVRYFVFLKELGGRESLMFLDIPSHTNPIHQSFGKRLCLVLFVYQLKHIRSNVNGFFFFFGSV